MQRRRKHASSEPQISNQTNFSDAISAANTNRKSNGRQLKLNLDVDVNAQTFPQSENSQILFAFLTKFMSYLGVQYLPYNQKKIFCINKFSAGSTKQLAIFTVYVHKSQILDIFVHPVMQMVILPLVTLTVKW